MKLISTNRPQEPKVN